jgi:cytochrome c oxidase subunit 2
LLGPETAHSPNADDLNTLYWVLLVVAAIAMVAINGALIALALRFRGGRGSEPRRVRSRGQVQFMLAGVLTAIAAALFAAGVVFTEQTSDAESSGPDGLQATSSLTAQRGLEPPAPDTEPLEIEASGQQWIWRYEYPDGTFSYYELVVPVDTTVIVNLDSTDVVHRWWVPGLGGKFDATPGQSNRTWFKADEVGSYDGASYQFSGPATAAMRTRVTVLSVTDYEAWLTQQAADIQDAQAFVQEQVAAGEPLDAEQEAEE